MFLLQPRENNGATPPKRSSPRKAILISPFPQEQSNTTVLSPYALAKQSRTKITTTPAKKMSPRKLTLKSPHSKDKNEPTNNRARLSRKAKPKQSFEEVEVDIFTIETAKTKDIKNSKPPKQRQTTIAPYLTKIPVKKPAKVTKNSVESKTSKFSKLLEPHRPALSRNGDTGHTVHPFGSRDSKIGPEMGESPKKPTKLSMEDNLKIFLKEEAEAKRLEKLDEELLKPLELESDSPVDKKNDTPVSTVPEQTNKFKAPGLNIFDCNHYLCYFSNNDDVFYANEEVISEFNRRRKSNMFLDKKTLRKLIKKCYFFTSSQFVDSNFMDFLFSYMLVEEDDIISLRCRQALEETIKKGLKWVPSLQLIASSLLNLGVVIDITCPRPNLFREMRYYLSIHKASPAKSPFCSDIEQCQHQAQHLAIVSCTRLCHILDLMTFICKKNLASYNSRDIAELVLVFSWIVLDSKLIDNPISTKIQQLCGYLLDLIQETEWPKNMRFISSEMLRRVADHQNIAYLITNLPESERGKYLKALTSYQAMHILVGAKTLKCHNNLVTPTEVLSLLKSHFTMGYNDYLFIQSFVSLICMSLLNASSYAPQQYKTTMEEIAAHLLTIYHQLKDCCNEAVMVKNAIVVGRFQIIIKSQGRDPENEESYMSCVLEEDHFQSSLGSSSSQPYYNQLDRSASPALFD